MQNALSNMSNMITARQKTPKVFKKLRRLNNGKYYDFMVFELYCIPYTFSA